MWRVEEHRKVEKQLDAAPKDILKRYEKWLDIAMISGPPGLRAIKGFRDEALSENGKAIVHLGYRSSIGSFTARWHRVRFPGVSVTAHDYRRP